MYELGVVYRNIQRADRAARRPGPHPARLHQRDPRAPAGAFPGTGQAEDAAASHRDPFCPCHRLTFAPIWPQGHPRPAIPTDYP